jgi:inner membrane protein YidH
MTTTLDTGTKLAVERTWLAHERTMMAWVRTATSLISFGFTIYKFFQLEINDQTPADVLVGSREFALLMIGMGLFSLAAGYVEHARSLRSIRTAYGKQSRSVAGLVAALVSGLGILALFLVAFRK